MPQLVYTMDEFRAMHGGNALADFGGELLPDGARITSMGVLLEPPTDPSALLQAKRRYVALTLQLEEAAWKQFKGDCEQMLANKSRYSNSQPSPAPDYKQQLERGAERIAKLREELAGLDREISQLPDEVARRAFFEQQRQRQHSAREQLNEIAGMTI